MAAGVTLVSNDKNWLGGSDRFSTTEGNDFWLTFMNNNMINPDDPANKANPEFKFEMNIGISAREAVTVVIATSQGEIARIPIAANSTEIYKIDREKAQEIYLLESEKTGKYGVHVYAAPINPDNKKKVFSCFLYSRVGESGGSSRDASYVLPTRFLGKEYIIQTSPEDTYSSEFAIVATDDGTVVSVTPSFETIGKKTAGTAFEVTLNRGEAYLIASKQHEGNEDFNVNLSGSRICANKPIAVFNGNQQMSLPVDEASTQDFAVEQALPVDKWGKEFYISLLDSTKLNNFIITAAFDGTTIDLFPKGYPRETHVLNAGESYPDQNSAVQIRSEFSEMIVKSDKPVTCYDYLSSAGDNPFTIGSGSSAFGVKLGDPANVMLPAWEHRTKKMNFFTHELDPQKLSGKEPPQIYKVYLVTRKADAGTVKLDNYTVPATQFTSFAHDDNMVSACLSVNGKNNYHTIETTGDGFVGIVYALSHAQGYMHALGFTPPNPADTLYVTHTEEVGMSHGSYDLDSVDGHGWYQRQWTEWMEKKERLDTAVVCDSSFVYWTLETPSEKPAKKIEWTIYDVTDGKKPGVNADIKNAKTEDPASGNTKHDYQYQFILPDEKDAPKKHQFFEYEIQAVLHRDRQLCTDDEDIDTLKTTVRVTRIYNDTLYRVVCVGDTLKFFYDSLYNQSDLNLYRPDSAATKFVGVKKGQGDKYIEPWVYQVEVGKYDTLSRHYLSQAGCDSTMTLVLMVCDTFQFFDTIHLCHNQDTLYHDQRIRGQRYKLTDTVDIDVPFKTHACECQLSEFANKFRDKNGRPFNGCDSTYHLHLFVHPNYVIPFRDTVCLTPEGKGTYTWTKERGGMYGRTFTEQDLTWSAADGAYKGVFRDSTYTKTCRECNDGKHGCDSIHELTLIMPKSYYFEENDTWCKLKYDKVKHDTIHEYYKWYGHMDGAPYIELKSGGTYRDECTTKRYGCDSIYQLNLTYQAATEVYKLVVDTICLDTSLIYRDWTDIHGKTIEELPLKNFSVPKNQRCTTVYRHEDSRCDTVYALHLTLLPQYRIVETKLITEEEAYTWEVTGKTYGGSKTTEETVPKPDSIITSDVVLVRHFDTKPVGTHFCDSIRILDLRVGNVYRDTTKGPEIYACGNDKQYEWIGQDHDGNDSVRMVIKEQDLPAPGTYKWYTDEYKTFQGFDSVFYLYLYRAPSYKDTTHVLDECQQRNNGARYIWEGHEGRRIYSQWGDLMAFIPLMYDGDYYYIDTMQTKEGGYGCDSVCVLHLRINPYYDKNAELQTCQGEPFVWEDLKPGYTAPDSILDKNGVKLSGPIPTNHIGDYEYTLKFHTIHGCDSAWHLKLHIDTVYKEPVRVDERVMCDNDTIHFLGDILYGVNSPLKPEGEAGIAVPDGKRWLEFDRQGDTLTVNGCDSAVHHHITIYKTYRQEYHEQRCQPNLSKGESIFMSWTRVPTDDPNREIWDVIRGKRIVASQIPINVSPGEYTYIDSMRTNACETCQGIGGCDSIHILYLQVDSSYHIREQYRLCDNDTMSWQGRFYRGEKFKGTAAEMAKYKELKSDTTYRDTVEIGSRVTPCDSTYYLTLRVAPTYDTTLIFHVCDNDSSLEAHVYEFRDKQGHYYRDSIEFNPTRNHPDGKNIRDQEGITKPVILQELEHPLQTIEGCDSLVKMKIYIHPTYRFIESDRGCAGHSIEWRDIQITGTGTYIVPLKTQDEWECDSVYELDFYVKPFITIPIWDQVCDNHTYYHRDTVGTTIFEEMLWWPGAVRPDTTFVRFQGADGCDSIVYEYHISVCPTYEFETDTNGLCLGKPFEYTFDPEGRNITHTWYGPAYEFDVDTFVLPFDTVFIDSLLTHRGCDSVFVLNTHAFPSYRHIEYDTICANQTYTWQARDERPDSLIGDLDPGIYFLRDSFITLDGCDSIYEIQLCVNANYVFTDSLTLCADETLQWRDHFYEHMRPGDYHFEDDSVSIWGCDSIFHLYLTVIDTTYEINYDSICIGDTFFVAGHMYMEAGDYKDTVTNEAGCRHFIYTHLAVIPPTVPTVWADDPMCQNERAFDLLYTYTSHKPLRYSLYFDSIGLSMGFEDMIDIPITSYTDPMVITVPIPYRGEDPTQYPRPNNYSVRLVLDNGICRHKETDCFHDSTFTMSYPKWITEQRFGDVIALLNENNNGGYVWTEYQWYHGDTLLPGQTQPYLYIPTGLKVGDQYYVMLTRKGEKEEFPTCPVTITLDPIINNYAPTMGYLSVVPTCVAISHPYINILSRKDGTYRITTSDGVMVSEGIFRADVTEVQVPQTAGMYVVQLWSYDTPEEPYRAIKIVIRDKCETCATSF